MADTAIDWLSAQWVRARLGNLTRDGTIRTELSKRRQAYPARAAALGLSPHEALAISAARRGFSIGGTGIRQSR